MRGAVPLTRRRGAAAMTPPDEPAALQSPPGGRVQRARDWLGLERNIVVMLAALTLIGMGEELWLRFVPKYLEALGATIFIIAIYGALKDFLDSVYQYPGGWAADHWGRRRALEAFAVIAIAGYVMYAVSPSWMWVLIGTLGVSAWASLTLPAIFAIVGDSLPSERRAIAFSMQSIIKRLPRVIAPALGGALIVAAGYIGGVRYALCITIALALLTLLVLRRFYRENAPRSMPGDGTNFRTIWRQMDSALKRLLVADCFARWAQGLIDVFVVLYVTNVVYADAPVYGAVVYGSLYGLQNLTSMLVYIPIAKMADRMNRAPFVLATFAFFALYPLVLVRATSHAWLVVAFIVGGLREIGEPARKALIVDLAPTTARGRSVGMYYLVRGLVVFPASLAGGWLYFRQPALAFYVAGAVGIAGCLVYAVWGRNEPQRESVSGGLTT